MIRIKDIDLPEDNILENVLSCASCGGHGNDIKIVEFFVTMKIRNRIRKASKATQLNLCRNCRQEAARSLEESCNN